MNIRPGTGPHVGAGWPDAAGRGRWRYWAVRLAGSDPGAQRFRAALQAVVTIAVALVVEWLFVRFTHALQLPQPHGLSAGAAAQVGLERHGVLVVAMLLGAMIGLVFAIGVTDPTPRGQLLTMLFLPVPMVVGLVVGLALGGHRVTSLVLFVVLLTAGTWARRYGPRGVMGGMLGFIGAFLGYFVQAEISLPQVGWPIAEIAIGVAVAVGVHFTVFRSRPADALDRMRRSWVARGQVLIDLAAHTFEHPEQADRWRRRVQRQLVRVNETTLMIDAQIVGPAALPPGSSAQLFHQRLFDMELALTNIARFAVTLASTDLVDRQASAVTAALDALRGGDLEAADTAAWTICERLDANANADGGVTGREPVTQTVLHRFAVSVTDFVAAQGAWLTDRGDDGDDDSGAVFRPAVALMGGWLPGSALVSAQASSTPGARRGDRMVLAAYLRTALQVGVAAAVAIAAGDALSGRRFYWSLLAVVVTFMGAGNSVEQARRAFFRVAGTIVGIGIGSITAQAVGHHSNWAIAVILVAIFFGLYAMRINYGLWVIGITVMVSQLYVQLDEFSNHLLVLRLEETAIGAAAAIATVLVVLPIRPRRVITVALRAHFDAIVVLLEHATQRLAHPHFDPKGAGSADLRADVRAVDAAHQALFATTQPLRRTLFGDVSERLETTLAVAAALRYHTRDLVADLDHWSVHPELVGDVEHANTVLRTSLGAIQDALNRRPHGTYTRCGALLDSIERRVETHRHGHQHPYPAGHRHLPHAVLALHDLILIDGALARLAATTGLPVNDLDTQRRDGIDAPVAFDGVERATSPENVSPVAVPDP